MICVTARRLLALTAACGAAVASGQITIEVQNTPGGVFTPAVLAPNTGAQAEIDSFTGEITILDGTANAYRVRMLNPLVQDLPRIIYEQPERIRLLVSANALEPIAGGALVAGARDWAGLISTTSNIPNVNLQMSLNGSLTGSIEAENIVRLDAGVSIGDDSSDSIYALAVAVPTISVIEALTGDINASIIIDGGSLGEVRAPAGSILGDIEATTGKIGRVFARDGIGSSANPVTIFAGADVSTETGNDRVTITYIGSNENIYAHIVASDTAAEEFRFGRLVANTAALLDGRIDPSKSDIGKTFTGSLRTFDSEGRVAISTAGAGDNTPSINVSTLDGTLRYFDVPRTQLAIRTVTASSLLTFDTGLNPPVLPGMNPDPVDRILTFTGPNATALHGQIVVNASDSSGAWDGKVGFLNDTFPTPTSDDIVFTSAEAPYYNELPSSFGGGAIGLVPFNFHPEASQPEHRTAEVLTGSQFQNYQATIEHYGPVFEGTAGGAGPIVIEFFDIGTSTWVDRTSQFDVIAQSSAASANREVSFDPAASQSWEVGMYRVSPDDLLCAAGDNTASVVYDIPSGCPTLPNTFYYFMVSDASGSSCPTCTGADLNGNGCLDPGDFTAWVAAYNMSDLAADQNCNGTVEPGDFTAWISNFNLGCL